MSVIRYSALSVSFCWSDRQKKYVSLETRLMLRISYNCAEKSPDFAEALQKGFWPARVFPRDSTMNHVDDQNQALGKFPYVIKWSFIHLIIQPDVALLKRSEKFHFSNSWHTKRCKAYMSISVTIKSPWVKFHFLVKGWRFKVYIHYIISPQGSLCLYIFACLLSGIAHSVFPFVDQIVRRNTLA